MTSIKHKLAFLAFAPTLFLSTGCDQLIGFDLTSGEPPPCVINGKTPTCEPPKPPQPPITNRG
jgi:hypothetical protein